MIMSSNEIFNKKIYLLHGINTEIIEYIKNFDNNSILTFDDGLRSLIKYRNELLKIKKEKKFIYIVFINPFFVLKSEAQSYIKNQESYEFIECFKAHENALKNNFENYLNLNELQILKNSEFEIGLHGWDHFIYNRDLFLIKMQPNQIIYNLIKKDIINSINFILPRKTLFKSMYGLYFAWPYNNEHPLYKLELNKYFKKDLQKYFKNLIYFGSERISGPWNYYEKDLNE